MDLLEPVGVSKRGKDTSTDSLYIVDRTGEGPRSVGVRIDRYTKELNY